ncbi:MAG: signal peptidase II [Candidatus Sumerlaeia bacterium]|nr:signal peptidase II [Candidatus Sumerlaeia bacterium]
MTQAVKEEKKELTEEEKRQAELPFWKRGYWSLWQASLGVFLFGLIADFVTKIWALQALKPEWYGYQVPPEIAAQTPVIDIIPGFLRFYYAQNEGAAFSILYGYTTLLAFISLAATIGLLWFWRVLPKGEVWGRIATAMILSGAVGNMYDRFFRGYVVDFIDAYVVLNEQAWHWPTFNIADSFICVGAAILAWRLITGKI